MLDIAELTSKFLAYEKDVADREKFLSELFKRTQTDALEHAAKICEESGAFTCAGRIRVTTGSHVDWLRNFAAYTCSGDKNRLLIIATELEARG